MVIQGTAKSLRLANMIKSNTETCIEHVITRRLMAALQIHVGRDATLRSRERSLSSTVVIAL